MKYSRNKINNAGDILLTSKDEAQTNYAISIIEDWRTLHLPVLDELHNSVVSILETKHISILSVSQRLKRRFSIQQKLFINPQMKLGGLQDIGGLRIVFPTMEVLNMAYEALKNNLPDNFELTKDPMNYILHPKNSGYRSIHFIYKYKSENPDLDGIRIELQLRTKLQHSWAMAVETAGLFTKTALKSSQGDENWLTFFKMVSSFFALEEGTPMLTEHLNNGYNTKNIILQLYKLNRDNNFIDTLKALNASIEYSKKENHKNGYYILNIDYERGVVVITIFSKNKEKKATQEYSVLEKQIEGKDHAVVLVSVPKIQELHEAYPSYFLDAEYFINIIEKEFENQIGDLNEKTFKKIAAVIYPDLDNQYSSNEKEFFDLVKQYKNKGEKK